LVCVDEEETQTGFWVWHVLQGGVMAVQVAEASPVVEDDVTGGSGFGDQGRAGDLQRSAEMRSEAISGRRVCMSQACGCG